MIAISNACASLRLRHDSRLHFADRPGPAVVGERSEYRVNGGWRESRWHLLHHPVSRPLGVRLLPFLGD